MIKKIHFMLFIFCFFLFGVIACSNNHLKQDENSVNYKFVNELEGFRFKVPKNDYKNFKDLSEKTIVDTSDLKYITTDKDTFFIQSKANDYFIIVNVNSLKDLNNIEEELNNTQPFQIALNSMDNSQITKATLKQPKINKSYSGYFSIVTDKNNNNAWMFVGFTTESKMSEAKYMIDSFESTNKRKKESQKETLNNEELQIIGNKDFGYLKIPKEFIKTTESPLQYKDSSENNLFTMNKITGSSPEIISKDLISLFNENKVKEIKEETVYIGYRKSLKISGIADKKYFSIWLFSDDFDKNITYYLSLTYDKEHKFLQDYISTWSINE